MILDTTRQQDLVSELERRMAVPPDAGVVLEGSIAEGFGNSTSDVDILLVVDDDHEHPSMPTILFVDGRRVEVRTRSIRQIHDQARLIVTRAARGTAGTASITVGELDRSQRFARAVVLRNPDVVTRARQILSADALRPIVRDWYARLARQSMRQAVALSLLGERVEATAWGRIAAMNATKSWAAARGETYRDPKWLPQQLDRIGPTADPIRRRLHALTDADAPDLPVPEYAAFVADCGVDGCRFDPGAVRTARRRHVTSWQIGDRVHVVRRRDVFVLNRAAGAAWRRIVFGRPTADLLGAAGADDGTGALIAEFQRLGLIELAWRRGGVIDRAQPFAPAAPLTPAPAPLHPVLGIRGGLCRDDDAPVVLLPVPAERFAAAGMAHVWSNIMVENALEDMDGALALEQWATAGIAAERLIVHACRVLLSSYGVSPLPPDAAMPTYVGRMRTVPERIRKEMDRLWAEKITSAETGREMVTGLRGLATLIRESTSEDVFPASFASTGEWEKTLSIGHDWIRIGAFMDAEIPIEEARDLFSTGGAQPHVVERSGDGCS